MKIQENTLATKENIKRLNRISGQVNGIRKMIDEGRSCPDVLVQLRAVSAAVKAIESNLLFSYINQMIVQSEKSEKDRQKLVDEMKVLFDRFRG